MKLEENSMIINSLYNDILIEYPFSIRGYEDAEEELGKFFEVFCQHPMIKLQRNVSFITGVFSTLNDINVLAQQNKLKLWNPEPINNFIFYDYDGSYADLVFSFYFYLLQSIGADSAVNAFTTNVRSNIDLRFKLTNGKHFTIHLLKRENFLEFRVPIHIYKEKYRHKNKICLDEKKVFRLLYNELITNFQKEAVDTEKAVVVNNEKEAFNFFYKVKREMFENPEIKKVYDKILNELLIEEEEEEDNLVTNEPLDDKSPKVIKAIKKRYKLDRYSNEIIKKVFNNPNADLGKLFNVAIAGSFLAGFYDVNLDYILSVCSVLKKGDILNLGGLAIGTEYKQPLSEPYISIFRIISNHIAANLAAQSNFILYSGIGADTPIQLAELRHDNSFKRLKHDYSKLSTEETIRLANEVSKIISSKTLVLSRSTKREISKRLDRIKNTGKATKEDADIFKSRLFIKHRELCEKLEKLILEDHKFKLTHTTQHKPLLEREINMDVDFVTTLVNRIAGNIEEHLIPNAQEIEVKFSAEFVDEHNKYLEFNPEEKFNPKKFRIIIEDNGPGFEIANLQQRISGTYYEFFYDNRSTYREVLNAHGQLIVESKGEKISSGRDATIEDSPKKDGTKVTLLIVLKHNER